MTRRALFSLVVATALLGATEAQASRAPTKAESKAIKKGFLEGRSKAATKIRKVRVSTVSRRYAAVTYSSDVRTSKAYKAPSPVVLKKGGKTWKPVGPGKVPGKVKKDLKAKTPVSDITISGELSARITRPARCDSSGVSIYDKASDLQFSIQQSRYKGNGFRPARAVWTVVAIYRNRGTELAYESGQPGDATAPSGFFYRDPGGWGLVDADLSAPPVPTLMPLAVKVKGFWVCG